MANFDINIAIRVLSQGIDNFVNMDRTFRRTTASAVEFQRAFENFSFRNIGTPLETANARLADTERLLERLANRSAFESFSRGGQSAVTFLRQIENELQRVVTLANQQERLELFTNANDNLRQIRQIRSEIEKTIQTTEKLNNRELSIKVEKDVVRRARDIGKALDDVAKKKADFEKTGNVKIKVEIDKLNRGLAKDLAGLLRESEVLTGESAIRINEILATVRSKLDASFASARNLANSSTIRRNQDNELQDIASNARRRQEIKSLTKDVSSLEKAIKDAIKDGNFTITFKSNIESQAQNIKSKLESISRNIQRNTTGAVRNSLLNSTADTGAKLDSIINSLPEANKRLGLLGAVVHNAANNFKNFNSAVTKTGGYTRAFAGSFRLIGNAAFVFGGELRGLGFLFNAFGSILQNFLPLFGSLISQAGAFGVALLGLVGILSAVTVAAIAFTASLAYVAKRGLELNSQFDRVVNSMAAIIAEFYKIETATGSANNAFKEVTSSADKYAISQALAREELSKLTLESIRTEFESKQLFEVYKALSLSLGGLAPNLSSVRGLTGDFARVASIAGISTEKLTSQVSLLVAGAGRTNQLTRIFNQLRDSEGILLTSKRIRELRAQGGAALFNELALAAQRFSNAAGDAQNKTLPGILSNFTDIFDQLVRQLGTPLYERLTGTLITTFGTVQEELNRQKAKAKLKALEDVKANTLVEKVALANAREQAQREVENSVLSLQSLINRLFTVKYVANKDGAIERLIQLNPELEKIKTALGDILEFIGKDFLTAVNKIPDYFAAAAEYLDENYDVIIKVYEGLVEVGSQILGITADVLKLFGVIENGTISLNNIARGLLYIADIIALIRGLFIRVEQAILIADDPVKLISVGIVEWSDRLREFVRTIPKVGEALDKYILNPLSLGAKGTLQVIDPRLAQITEEHKRLAKEVEDRQKIYKKLDDIEKTRANNAEQYDPITGRFVKKSKSKTIYDPITGKQIVVNNPSSDRSSERGIKSVVDLDKTRATPIKPPKDDSTNKRFRDIERSTLESAKRLNEAAIKLATDREKRELEVVREYIKRREDELNAALDVSVISQQEYYKRLAELRTFDLEAEIQSRKNRLAVANREELNSVEEFLAEEQRLRRNYAKQPSDRKKPDQLASELANLQAKLDEAKIKKAIEVEKIQGEINALERSRVDIIREQTTKQIKLTQELRKQLEQLKLNIDELGGNQSEAAIRRRLDAIVQESYDKLKTAQNTLETLQKRGANTFLPPNIDKLPLEEQAKLITNANNLYNKSLEYQKEIINGLTEEIRLKQEIYKYEQLGLLAQQAKDRQQLAENDINRRLATGRITQAQSEIELNAERKKTAAVLTEIADKAEAAANASGDIRKKLEVQRLRDEIKDLGKNISETFAITFKKDAYDSLETFFEKIQENVGDTKTAFADLGKSILASFRRIIAQRLTEELFGSLLKPRQTEGKVDGLLGRIFRRTGLEPAEKRNQEADKLAKEKLAQVTDEERGKLIDKASQQSTIEETLARLSGTVNGETKLIKDTLDSLNKGIDEGGSQFKVGLINLAKALQDVVAVVKQGKQIPGTKDTFTEKFKFNPYNTEGSLEGKKSTKFNDLIEQTAKAAGINPELLYEVVNQESKFNPTARSNQGAKGLGQLLDGTAKRFGVKNPYNPAQNLKGSAEYLKYLLDLFGGDVDLALAAYHSGEGSARAALANPKGNPKTNNYVKTIGSKLTGADKESIDKANPLNAEPVNVNNFSDLLNTLTQYNSETNSVIKGSATEIKDTVNQAANNVISAINGLARGLSGSGNNISGLFNSSGSSSDFDSLLETLENFTPGYAKGTIFKGRGTGTSDSILARVSKGEAILPAKLVKKLLKFAGGGLVDPEKYSYVGGGAKLISAPTPISEGTVYNTAGNLATVGGKAPKKRGGFLGFLGKALSFAAPFLNFIPGIGPLLALGAGAAGGALSGAQSGGLKGGILGGILGGLGNLGGFAGKAGTLGKIGTFFSSKGGGGQILDTLSLFGYGSGASNPAKGKLNFKSIFKLLGKGNLKLPGFAGGGLVDGISGFFSGIFGKLKGLFGSSGSGNNLGGNLSSSSALNNKNNDLTKLLGLFSLSSALGSLFGGGSGSSQQQVQYEPDIIDPDTDRKNLLGSAYNTLTGNRYAPGFGETGNSVLGSLPEFGYTDATIKRLFDQQEGIRVPIKKSGSGFLGKLFGGLGSILSIASLFGGEKKNPFNDPKFVKLKEQFTSGNFVEIPAKANGGLLRGPGTGTSDSILAMVSNGEYVIPANVVRNIGVNALDSIVKHNKYAEGGLVGTGVASIPDSKLTGTDVNQTTNVVNVLDPKLLHNYMSTKEGEKLVLNIIGKNPTFLKKTIR